MGGQGHEGPNPAHPGKQGSTWVSALSEMGDLGGFFGKSMMGCDFHPRQSHWQCYGGTDENQVEEAVGEHQ